MKNSWGCEEVKHELRTLGRGKWFRRFDDTSEGGGVEVYEKTFYSGGQGMAIISDNKDEVLKIIVKRPVKILESLVKPEEKTSLFGFFSREVEYLGVLKGEDQKEVLPMVFYLGSQVTLFKEIHYFNVLIRVTDTRLFEKTSERTGRDYRYVSGVWK